MEVLKIDPNNPDPSIIDAVVGVLRQGGILVYPTDTCYGLGADARNVRAMTRIADLKGREAAKKFSVILRDIEHIQEIAVVSDLQHDILAHYLPGPYTFILINADFSVAQTSTLGVRMPHYPVTQLLADEFGDAYITSSANLSGQGAIYSVDDLRREFLDKVPQSLWPDVVLDAGSLEGAAPSTVVDLTVTPAKIIRQGGASFRWPLK